MAAVGIVLAAEAVAAVAWRAYLRRRVSFRLGDALRRRKRLQLLVQTRSAGTRDRRDETAAPDDGTRPTD